MFALHSFPFYYQDSFTIIYFLFSILIFYVPSACQTFFFLSLFLILRLSVNCIIFFPFCIKHCICSSVYSLDFFIIRLQNNISIASGHLSRMHYLDRYYITVLYSLILAKFSCFSLRKGDLLRFQCCLRISVPHCRPLLKQFIYICIFYTFLRLALPIRSSQFVMFFLLTTIRSLLLQLIICPLKLNKCLDPMKDTAQWLSLRISTRNYN